MGELAGGECTEELQTFSASDLHRCFHQVAKMHRVPEARASWCESDGTWTLWQVAGFPVQAYGVYSGGKSRQAHKQQDGEAAKSRGRNRGGVPPSRLTQTHQLLPDVSLPCSAFPLSLLCFSFSLQVLFYSRDSSAGLQGCSWPDNLGVGGSFFGVRERCRESWSPARISPLWEATGNMPLCSTPRQYIPGVSPRRRRNWLLPQVLIRVFLEMLTLWQIFVFTLVLKSDFISFSFGL